MKDYGPAVRRLLFNYQFARVQSHAYGSSRSHHGRGRVNPRSVLKFLLFRPGGESTRHPHQFAATVSPWNTGSPFHRCSILNQESLPFGFVYSALFLSLATCCGFIPNTSGFSLMKLLTTLSRDSEEGGVRNLRPLTLGSTT